MRDFVVVVAVAVRKHQLRGKRRNEDEGRKGTLVVVVVVVMVVVVIEFFSVWCRMRCGSSH